MTLASITAPGGWIRRALAALVLLSSALAPAGASAQVDPPIQVALILALSGIAAEDNRPAIDGARLAVEEINARGGVLRRELELVLLDNHSSPLGSKAAAEHAVHLGVTAVVGGIWSSHALQMAYVLQSARVPMLTPTASMPEVTRVGDFIFRICFTDDMQGRVMARFSRQDLQLQRVAVLSNASEQYSLILAQHYVQSFAQLGGEVAWQGTYKGTAIDFSEQIAELKRVAPEAVFIPGYARDSGLLMRQARLQGVQAIFLGGDAWGAQVQQVAGGVLGRAYASSFWHPEVDYPRNRHLKQAFGQRYGTERYNDMRIPLTYDALLLLADAIARAGSVERDALRSALAATRQFPGATGTLSFDEHRNPINKEACIIELKHDHWNLLKTVAP